MSTAIREISGQEFADALHVRGRRIPIEGAIETTYRCNLNCVHCYVNLPAADAGARERELSTSRLLQLVDEVADAGTLTLLLTGGEVLLRPDFAEVYLHAVRRGLRIVIFSNGTMVTERIAALLAEYPPIMVEVTLYGATEATYDAVTRVPGSYRRCLDGIARLRDHGVRFMLKTTLVRQNVDELDQMKAIADSFGVEFRWDGELNARVDCGAPRGEFQVDPERLVALDFASPARARAVHAMLEGARQGAVDGPLYDCGAGKTGYTVDPWGQLQLCQTSRKNGYDLKRGTFEEGWGTHLGRLVARDWQGSPVCRGCSLRAGCGNCPGAAELETGSPEGFVAAFCEITHRRAFGALPEVPGHVADATCCLGRAGVKPRAAAGCGGCSHAAEPVRLQIQRRA